MEIELVDVLKRLAEIRGTTLEHEVARHNMRITEERLDMVANGKPLPCANQEEREARLKACRKRAVDKARERRQAKKRQFQD